MKNHKKITNAILLVLLMLVLAFSVAGCKKKSGEGAESNITVSTSAESVETADTENVTGGIEKDETEGTEIEGTETGETETEGGILEEDGELIIEVPDDIDTYGE